MRTIKNLFKQDKEKFNPPKSVQDTIPVQTIYKDGIFLVGKNTYSKSFRFTDINYQISREEDQLDIFERYSKMLNYFDDEMKVLFSINNRRIDLGEVEKEVVVVMISMLGRETPVELGLNQIEVAEF